MPGITAVILTLNEEKNIGRCLASLQGVADEVIVLDSHSTDRTAEICQAFGVRFQTQEWLGYSATKNHGHSLASHPYILSIDADEALSPELRDSILQAKNTLSGAYSFNRLNHYAGVPVKQCGWYPDRKIRLFPIGKAAWQGAFVHETLELVAGVEETVLKGDLLHYTYESVEDHRRRARRYADLAAQKIAQSGKGGLFWKMLFSPAFRFIKMYLFQGGIGGGKYAFYVAWITAWEVREKYRGARILRKQRAK